MNCKENEYASVLQNEVSVMGRERKIIFLKKKTFPNLTIWVSLYIMTNAVVINIPSPRSWSLSILFHEKKQGLFREKTDLRSWQENVQDQSGKILY